MENRREFREAEEEQEMGKATCNWGSARSEIKWAHFYGQRRGGGRGGGLGQSYIMGWATMVVGEGGRGTSLGEEPLSQQPAGHKQATAHTTAQV